MSVKTKVTRPVGRATGAMASIVAPAGGGPICDRSVAAAVVEMHDVALEPGVPRGARAARASRPASGSCRTSASPPSDLGRDRLDTPVPLLGGLIDVIRRSAHPETRSSDLDDVADQIS